MGQNTGIVASIQSHGPIPWDSHGKKPQFSLEIGIVAHMTSTSGWLGNEHRAAPGIQTPRTLRVCESINGGSMGVHKNGVPPKWMVYKGKSQSKRDDLGVPPSNPINLVTGIHFTPAHQPASPPLLQSSEFPNVTLALPSVKVTPDSQSTPASATISPAPASGCLTGNQ